MSFPHSFEDDFEILSLAGHLDVDTRPSPASSTSTVTSECQISCLEARIATLTADLRISLATIRYQNERLFDYENEARSARNRAMQKQDVESELLIRDTAYNKDGRKLDALEAECRDKEELLVAAEEMVEYFDVSIRRNKQILGNYKRGIRSALFHRRKKNDIIARREAEPERVKGQYADMALQYEAEVGDALSCCKEVNAKLEEQSDLAVKVKRRMLDLEHELAWVEWTDTTRERRISEGKDDTIRALQQRVEE